jgi:hypothetical protein
VLRLAAGREGLDDAHAAAAAWTGMWAGCCLVSANAMHHHASRSYELGPSVARHARIVNVVLKPRLERAQEMNRTGIARVAKSDIDQLESDIVADELHIIRGGTAKSNVIEFPGREPPPEGYSKSHVDKVHADGFREMETNLRDCVRMSGIAAELMLNANVEDDQLRFAVFHSAEMLTRFGKRIRRSVAWR